jgi:hypothetical protein
MYEIVELFALVFTGAKQSGLSLDKPAVGDHGAVAVIGIDAMLLKDVQELVDHFLNIYMICRKSDIVQPVV